MERNRNSEKHLRENGKQYLERIKSNKWDTEAWSLFLNELFHLDIELARPYYQKFFKYYPTSGRVWKQYLQHEIMGDSPREVVKQIWTQCLPNTYNVELWLLYIQYVTSLGTVSEDCFRVALQHVGEDIWSSEIYAKYLTYLMDNNTDIEKTRSVFHTAMNTPMHNMEQIWSLYEKFENTFSSSETKKMIAERGKKFQETRKKYVERRKNREGLLLHMLSSPIQYQTDKLIRQKEVWKKIVECEKRNTQRLDTKIIKKRVVYAFNQSLTCLRHLNEVWFEFAKYLISSGDLEGADEVFKRASIALPDNYVLHFANIDFLETIFMKVDRARELFNELLKRKNFPPVLLVQYLKFLDRNGGIMEVRRGLQLMKSTKQIWNQKTYHLYVTLAMCEYNQKTENNVRTAKTIFDIGFKTYSSNPAFVMEYVKFLEHIRDISSLRILYERVFERVVDSGRFFELFNRYVQFELEHGDSTTLSLVEEKFFDTYPNLRYKSPIKSVIRKFGFLDLSPSPSFHTQFIDGVVPRNRRGRLIINEEEDEGEDDEDEEDEDSNNMNTPFIFTPNTSEMIECNQEQLKNIVKNPNINLELLSDRDLTSVAKLLPVLPQLTGEHLPNVGIVLKTLQDGPEPTFEQVEKYVGKKRKRDPNEIQETPDIYAKRRKVK